MLQQPEINAHHVYRPFEDDTPPQTNTNQPFSNHNALDLNQSVVKLFRHQAELTHSIQCLHQQTTGALSSITRSSLHQGTLHFINIIPIFKAKDPQSFDDWLEEIDKIVLLTNIDPYKCALVKSQGSFSRTISSYALTHGTWNKIKEIYTIILAL